MKNTLALFIISFLTLPTFEAFADNQKKFYVCEGFAGIEEYRVGIDLKKETAWFFDNDTTSELTLVETKHLESIPTQTVYVFSGPSESYSANLNLEFNLTKLKASLVSTSDSTEDLGTVQCLATQAWD